jgi:hypothetical protein
MITYKIKDILDCRTLFLQTVAPCCDPSPIIHRSRDWEGQMQGGSRSQRTQARSVLKSRRWSCARHRDAQLEIATGGSIDFHSAMPENRGVAAGVAMAIAAAKNAIG